MSLRMTERTTVPLPLTGGCQCDSTRYEISEMPLTLYACHCTECQKQSSSGFGMSMPVPKSRFSVIAGEPKSWERIAESGNIVSCYFCSVCGTRLFHRPARNGQIVNVKPGTLDDTKWLNPVGHLWIKSAQPWVAIPEDIPCFESQPESFEPLFSAWNQKYASGVA